MNKQELIKELEREGFSQEIIRAFEKVKREDFILDDLKTSAYENNPLPIGFGQTISQPYTIAFMLDLLDIKNELKILEVGSGSGYVLALINELSEGSKIFGVERIKELAEKSEDVLKEKKNIKIIHGDGLKEFGKEKFDRILVSAAADKIPKEFIKKLNSEGILVIPVKNSIFKIKKENRKIIEKEYPGFVFVPLIGGND